MAYDLIEPDQRGYDVIEPIQKFVGYDIIKPIGNFPPPLSSPDPQVKMSGYESTTGQASDGVAALPPKPSHDELFTNLLNAHNAFARGVGTREAVLDAAGKFKAQQLDDANQRLSEMAMTAKEKSDALNWLELINTPTVQAGPGSFDALGIHSTPNVDEEKQLAELKKQNPKLYGVREATDEFLSSMTSPLSLGTFGAAGVLEGVPQFSRALSALFAVQTGKQLATETATQLGEEMAKPKEFRDESKLTQLWTSAAFGVPFAGALGSHAILGDKAPLISKTKDAGAPLTADALAEKLAVKSSDQPLKDAVNNIADNLPSAAADESSTREQEILAALRQQTPRAAAPIEEQRTAEPVSEDATGAQMGVVSSSPVVSHQERIATLKGEIDQLQQQKNAIPIRDPEFNAKMAEANQAIEQRRAEMDALDKSAAAQEHATQSDEAVLAGVPQRIEAEKQAERDRLTAEAAAKTKAESDAIIARRDAEVAARKPKPLLQIADDPQLNVALNTIAQALNQVQPQQQQQPEKRVAGVTEADIAAGRAAEQQMRETGGYTITDAVRENGGLGGPDLKEALDRMASGESAQKIASEYGDGYGGLADILETINEARKGGRQYKAFRDLVRAYSRAGFGDGGRKTDTTLDGMRSMADRGHGPEGGVPESTEDLISRAWEIAQHEVAGTVLHEPGLFGQPESMQEQKARMRAEAAQKAKLEKERQAKADMVDRAAKPLIGADVDTTKEMFGAETRQDKSGQGSLFEPERDRPFYSRLTRAVEQSQQGKATGTQWKGLIKNSKLGANADEMALVGVKDLEDGKSYTKAEVLDHLRANEVVVKDVTLGEKDNRPVELLRFGDLPKERQQSVPGHDMVERNDWVAFVDGEYAGTESSAYGREQALREINIARREAELGNAGEATQFSTYQLPGAKEGSYREVLLTVPKQNVGTITEQAKVVAADHGDNWDTLGPNGRQQYEDFVRRRFEKGGGWRDGHSQYSDVANPIVRLRFNERTTSDGKRMLFLEEVQAPQKGQFEKMPALFQKNWRDIAFKWALRHASENGFDSLGWTTGEHQSERYDLSKHLDKVVWIQDEAKAGVSGGSNTGNLKGFKDGDVIISEVISRNRVEDYVGKDVAKKLLESAVVRKNSNGHGVREISGLDLKVGGGGLKKLYDQDFRNVVNNLPAVKKAGQKVGMTGINAGDKPKFTIDWQPNASRVMERVNEIRKVWDSPGRTPEGWQNWNTALDAQASDVLRLMLADKSYQQAMEQAGSIQLANKLGLGGEWVKSDVTEKIHSIEITPAIRESVMAGQPLFEGRKGNVESSPAHVRETISKGGKVRDVLDSISKSDSAFAPLARELLRRSDPKSLDIPVAVNKDVTRSRWTDEGGERIELAPDAVNDTYRVMHELLHPLTATKGKGFKPMEDLFNEAKGLLGNDAKDYGFTKPQEFVAEAFTNPEFQRKLRDIQVPKENRTLWQKFISTVRNLFRLQPATESMLDKVVSAGARVIEAPRKGSGETLHEPDTSEPTGIRKSVIDKERRERELEKVKENAKYSFPGKWYDAVNYINDHPGSREALAEDLIHSPREVSDLEVAMLAHYRVDLRTSYDAAARELIDAVKSGDADRIETAKVGELSLQKRLTDFDQMNRIVGGKSSSALNLRRFMVDMDYSLASMVEQASAAKGGEALDAEEVQRIEAMHREITNAQAELDKYYQAKENEAALAASKRAHEDLIESAPRTPRKAGVSKPRPIKRNAAVEAAKALLLSKGRRVLYESGELDQDVFDAYATIGAAHIEDGLTGHEWYDEMTHQFGDEIRPHLDKIYDRAMEGAKAIGAENTKSATSKIDRIYDLVKERMADGESAGDCSGLIQKLAKIAVEGGVRNRDALIDAVQEGLKSHGIEMERRDVMNAISGYGDYKRLSQEEVAVELRRMKGELQQVAKLEDLNKGQAPLKTGVERRTPSDEERRMIKQVNELRKKLGIVSVDPARQLRSTLDSIKTRLTNRIKDLREEIATGEKTVKTKSPTPSDAESEKLRTELAAVKAEHDAIFGNKELTDEQRLKIATKAAERAETDWTNRLEQAKKGNFDTGKKSPKPITSPELDAIRARTDAAKEEVKLLKDLAEPKKTRDEIALQSLKTRLKNSTADLLYRAASKDFAPKPKRSIIPDAEASALRVANEKVRDAFEELKSKYRRENRTRGEKFRAGAVRWSRIAKLSSIHVFPKLIESGIIRVVTDPIGRVLGQPLRVIPGLAGKAPYELGLSLKAEAANIAGILTSGKPALEKLRTGKTNIDYHAGETRTDQEMLNFVGNSHGMIKEPVRQGVFKRSVQLRTEAAVRAGLNPLEPAIATAIESAAAADANRGILMGENAFSKYMVNVPIAALRSSKATSLHMLADAIEFVMPIVRVSSNIAVHTTRLHPAVGFGEAAARLINAARKGELRDGAKNLSAEDAAVIARSFKLGMAGLLITAYAWNNPQRFGGIYSEEDKKRPAGLKSGAIKVFDTTLPPWMNHAPEINMLNTIASARRVYDRYYTVKNHPKDEADRLTDVLAFTLMSPIKDFPMIDTWLRTFSDTQTMGQSMGRLTRDAVVPGVVVNGMNALDNKERSPKSFWQEWKMATPWREDVPAKKP